jgi:hypothetical protein
VVGAPGLGRLLRQRIGTALLREEPEHQPPLRLVVRDQAHDGPVDVARLGASSLGLDALYEGVGALGAGNTYASTHLRPSDPSYAQEGTGGSHSAGAEASELQERGAGAKLDSLTVFNPSGREPQALETPETTLGSVPAQADQTKHAPHADGDGDGSRADDDTAGSADEDGQDTQGWGTTTFLNFRRLPARFGMAGLFGAEARKMYVVEEGDFDAVDSFDGPRPGWVFKNGDRGLGYYKQAGRWEDAPVFVRSPREATSDRPQVSERMLPNFKGGAVSASLDQGLGMNRGFGNPIPAVYGPVAMGAYGTVAPSGRPKLGPVKEDLSIYKPVEMPEPKPEPKKAEPIQPRMVFGGKAKPKPSSPAAAPNPAPSPKPKPAVFGPEPPIWARSPQKSPARALSPATMRRSRWLRRAGGCHGNRT